jgi:hypothetical protein
VAAAAIPLERSAAAGVAAAGVVAVAVADHKVRARPANYIQGSSAEGP